MFKQQSACCLHISAVFVIQLALFLLFLQQAASKVARASPQTPDLRPVNL